MAEVGRSRGLEIIMSNTERRPASNNPQRRRLVNSMGGATDMNNLYIHAYRDTVIDAVLETIGEVPEDDFVREDVVGLIGLVTQRLTGDPDNPTRQDLLKILGGDTTRNNRLIDDYLPTVVEEVRGVLMARAWRIPATFTKEAVVKRVTRMNRRLMGDHWAGPDSAEALMLAKKAAAEDLAVYKKALLANRGLTHMSSSRGRRHVRHTE